MARSALDAGATIVNDVSAFRFDPGLVDLAAERGAGCCLMHMLGEPRTMQEDPRYDDVVDDVKSFLEERLSFAVARGVPEEGVWLDPGIGFGKTVEPQPRAAAPPGGDRRDRAPGGGGNVAQELPGQADRRQAGGGAGAGNHRHERDRVRARCDGFSRP